MNPFVLALGLLILVAWVGSGIGLLVGCTLWLRRNWREEMFFSAFALLGVALGLGMLLTLAGIWTGGINFASRPDGCYYVHRELVGKTVITKYDPIECIGVPVR